MIPVEFQVSFGLIAVIFAIGFFKGSSPQWKKWESEGKVKVSKFFLIGYWSAIIVLYIIKPDWLESWTNASILFWATSPVLLIVILLTQHGGGMGRLFALLILTILCIAYFDARRLFSASKIRVTVPVGVWSERLDNLSGLKVEIEVRSGRGKQHLAVKRNETEVIVHTNTTRIHLPADTRLVQFMSEGTNALTLDVTSWKTVSNTPNTHNQSDQHVGEAPRDDPYRFRTLKYDEWTRPIIIPRGKNLEVTVVEPAVPGVIYFMQVDYTNRYRITTTATGEEIVKEAGSPEMLGRGERVQFKSGEQDRRVVVEVVLRP